MIRNSTMNIIIFFTWVFIQNWFNYGKCKLDIHNGYQVSVAVPAEYNEGFVGRAFLMETSVKVLSFRAALSVEAIERRYACSLDVFLGNVRVWNSGHLWKFYTTEMCVIELTNDGDLRLKGPNERVGWRSGTHGQGVQRLQLLRTGNLVLVDKWNVMKWQSFNFPTDVMLWGQRLDVATRLTSFTTSNSSGPFYSFEVQHSKIALYLNSGKQKYSYWEHKPSLNRNINFIQISSRGLGLFNDDYEKIGQIPSQRLEPLRFLALGNNGTGNLGLYYYSSNNGNFEASFEALNTTCDLPLACKPYGICTFSNTCSCIKLLTKENETNYDCGHESSGRFCGQNQTEMLEVHGVTSVLKNEPNKASVSKEVCAKLCLEDCNCVAALFKSAKGATKIQECYHYEIVQGIKQVDTVSGSSYYIKVLKRSSGERHGKSLGAKKWVLILVGVIDVLILIFFFIGLGYYLIRKNLANTLNTNNT